MSRWKQEGAARRIAAVATGTVRRSCALLAIASLVAVLGCDGAPDGDAWVGAPAPARIVLGFLAYGETSAPVVTSGVVRVRGFAFEGAAGDRVTVDLRSSDGGDATAWLFAADGRLLAHDHGGDGTADAHLEVTLAGAGVHTILFVDAAYRRRTFTVELQGGPPARPPLAIGLTWSDSRLVSFDPAAGRVEQVHLQMGPESFIAMTYAPDHHVLYAVSQVAWNLYAIDPTTMRASHRGNLRIDTRPSRGEDVQALAYDPTRGVLFATVVRFEDLSDRTTWSTDLVRVDVAAAAVTTVGTIPRLLVSSMDIDDRDGQLYGIATGVDGMCRVVRIDPDDATTVEVVATPYPTMLGFARWPGTGTYLSWINADSHFYAAIDLDRRTLTRLGDADPVGVIAAFVHRTFDAAVVSVPRPEVAVTFELTGRVLAVRDRDDLLDGAIAPGDPVTGRLVHDVNAPYRWAADAGGGYGFALSIGGAELAIDTLVAQVGNDVFDDRSGAVTDSIFLDAVRDGRPGFPVPMDHERIGWRLTDATARALANNDVLPVAYDLAAWDGNLLTIRAASDEYADDGYTITAIVTAITPE
jgi:hypothetical protein